MNIVKQWNGFFRKAQESGLTSNDQVVYMHILNALNQARWAEPLNLSDGELLVLCNMHDDNGAPCKIDKLRRCKQRLKNKGFINFIGGHGVKPSQYWLPKLYDEEDPPDETRADSRVQTPAHSPAHSPADSAGNSTLPVRAKTALKGENEKTKAEQSGRARATWEALGGKPLSEDEAEQLRILEGFYGADWLERLIVKAKSLCKYPPMSFNFLMAMAHKHAPKGGTSNGRNYEPADEGAYPDLGDYE